MSRLVREISLMEMLKHDNIVKLFETYETCDSLFLIMEYIPGMNLDEYLHKNGGHLTEDQARLFFRQIVSAIYFCHNRWVVHRDLKTPNILVTPNGVIKLADFGLGNRFGLQRLKTICGKLLIKIIRLFLSSFFSVTSPCTLSYSYLCEKKRSIMIMINIYIYFYYRLNALL